MSGLERWLGEARDAWEALRIKASRLAPAPVSSQQLAADDPVTRWRAARALTARPRAALLPDLLTLVGDEDAMVRAAAVDALVSWGPTIVLEPVRQALAQSPSPESAIALLEILARLPDPANRAAIQPWLAHERPDVQAAACMALAALCDDADLPALRRALKTGNRPLQMAILTTLCAPGAEPLAQRAADSRDPVLSQRGRQALDRIRQRQRAETDKIGTR